MTAQALLNELNARGIRLEPRSDGNLHVTPKARLTPELLEAVRQHKAELLAAVSASEHYDPSKESKAVSAPPLLADIADAIANVAESISQ